MGACFIFTWLLTTGIPFSRIVCNLSVSKLVKATVFILPAYLSMSKYYKQIRQVSNITEMQFIHFTFFFHICQVFQGIEVSRIVVIPPISKGSTVKFLKLFVRSMTFKFLYETQWTMCEYLKTEYLSIIHTIGFFCLNIRYF